VDKDEDERTDGSDDETSEPRDDASPADDAKDKAPEDLEDKAPADDVGVETPADGAADEPETEPEPAAGERPTVEMEPAGTPAAVAAAKPGPADAPGSNATKPKRHRGRKIGAVVMIVLTALFTLLSVIGVWVNRSIYNEAQFTAVVTPVANDPQVLDPLATYLTVQALKAIDLQGRIDSTLSAIGGVLPGSIGDRLGSLAAPLQSAAQQFVESKVQEFLHSPGFRETFNSVVVAAHGKLVALIKGDYSQLPNINASGSCGDASDGPTVCLNTIPIIANVLRNVAQGAVDFIGLNVTIPQITPDMVPSRALQILGAALGVSLPPNFGQIPIMSSEKLHSYQSAAKLFNQLIVLFIVLAVVCFVLAVVLSVRRRRTLVQLGLAIAGILVLAGILLRGVVHHVVAGIQSSGAKSAANDIVPIMGANLRAVGRLVLWPAVALAVIAYLAGKPRWLLVSIAAVRRVSVEGQSGSRLAAFVAERYDVLLAAAAGIALILFAIFGIHWASVIVIGLLLAVVVWWLTALRSGERSRTEPAAA
jgi:ABC-type multidrug transport system fused ATPase/permease subunit